MAVGVNVGVFVAIGVKDGVGVLVGELVTVDEDVGVRVGVDEAVGVGVFIAVDINLKPTTEKITTMIKSVTAAITTFGDSCLFDWVIEIKTSQEL